MAARDLNFRLPSNGKKMYELATMTERQWEKEDTNSGKLFACTEKNDPQEQEQEVFNAYFRSYPTLKEICDHLTGNPPRVDRGSLSNCKHHVDKQAAFCFTTGSNRNQAGLENAKNRRKIRVFQRVLGIEKGVMPRWCKVMTD
ncbi:hypothetical protein BS47DRAFT_737448 [Hydnum rufescens UP504]|uniref:Uncharacterized protein n=1 Tax=Hydnum rufescens UP504 TaxID=1448309 RepID=A0A9P6AE24_9AGAM|nr:hypothetical protein BS47DRAFT_737448 [Hydnum rufescens UP504]